MEEPIYAPKIDYPAEGAKRKSFGAGLIDFIQTFVVFGAIFAILYWQIAQPHKVSGNSMLPNFQDGNFILTDKVSYKIGTPQRGDVIVLKNPRNESVDFIKRIIGLPGDRIKISDEFIYVNDARISEVFLPAGTITSSGSFLRAEQEIIVPDNEYFALGDNREHSSDSREIGTIRRDLIIGKVFLRYWPPQVIGLIKHYPLD